LRLLYKNAEAANIDPGIMMANDTKNIYHYIALLTKVQKRLIILLTF